MAKTSKTVEQKTVCVMSDNLNYLCVKAKEIMDSGNFGSIELVYDSVLNRKAKGVTVSYENSNNVLEQVRDLFGTSEYKNVSIVNKEDEKKSDKKTKVTGSKESSEGKSGSNTTGDNEANTGAKGAGKATVVGKAKEENQEEAHAGIRRGAPSLSQEVLDFRYDVLFDYANNKITAEEAMQKLNVTEGVFRNLVSEFNKCRRENRKKAFGKAGIIKRTYKLYTENKISSEQAAENLNISVATFLKWYKKDTGNVNIGRGTKRVKK